MILKIGHIPQIDIIISDTSFEIFFEKNKPENVFLYNDLIKVGLRKGKRFLLISLVSWIMEQLLGIFIEKVYRDSDEFQIIRKNNKIIKKELISDKIYFENLDLAIQTINTNIKRISKRKTMPNII